jgi:hypothetical protein
MERLVKGSSAKFVGTVYLDNAKTILASLIGATVKLYVKARATDTDANALFTVNGSVTSTQLATYEAAITAANTNSLQYNKIFGEVVIKLNDGTFIRTGVVEIALDENVMKTLF